MSSLRTRALNDDSSLVVPEVRQEDFVTLPDQSKRPLVKFVYHGHSYGIATLLRVGLKIAGRGFYLHHFRPHTETEFHDHPWDFRTIVLWGSYVDESLDQQGRVHRDRLRPLSTRFRSAAHAHRTTCEGSVITLVFTSRKKREWCKGSPAGWVCDGEVEDFDATRGMVKVRD